MDLSVDRDVLRKLDLERLRRFLNRGIIADDGTVRWLPIAGREEWQQKVAGRGVGSSGCDKLVGFDGKGRSDPWPEILPVSLNSRKTTVVKRVSLCRESIQLPETSDKN